MYTYKRDVEKNNVTNENVSAKANAFRNTTMQR